MNRETYIDIFAGCFFLVILISCIYCVQGMWNADKMSNCVKAVNNYQECYALIYNNLPR